MTEIDRLLEKSKEKEEQLIKEWNDMTDRFWKQHDPTGKPSIQVRRAGAWTRDNIILDSWNRYLHYSEKISEFAGEYPEGEGFKTIVQENRGDLMLDFSKWFQHDIEYMIMEGEKL